MAAINIYICTLLLFFSITADGNEKKESSHKTEDPTLQSLNVQIGFYELWLNSGINKPLNERSEQGAWVVTNERNGFEVIPFPHDWASSACEIYLPPDYLDYVPSNLAGIAHTHPFHEGDNTSAPDVCGSEASSNYRSGGNHDDLQFLVDVANYLSNYDIRAYVIDGDNIATMKPWGEVRFFPAESFFRNVTVGL